MVKINEKKSVRGVSHPKKKSVNIRFDAEQSEQIVRAAKESKRSVAGFVRFAALWYLEYLNQEA